MKQGIVAIALIFSVAPAFATTFICKRSGPFRLVLSVDKTTAKVSKKKGLGIKTIAELTCSVPENNGEQETDGIHTVLVCRQKDKKDMGHAVKIQTNGLAANYTATLLQISFVGEKPVASFLCTEN